MALNSQHKRISKNRVSLTYDVETNGSMESKELPFVVGVIGDFAGHKPESEKEEVDFRNFIDVDKDNFDTVMSKVDPQLRYRIDNKITDSDEQFEVNLSFKSIRDFDPVNVVRQIDPLRELMDIRNQLKELLSKADRSRELEKLLKDILQNQEASKALISELGLNAGGDKE